MKIKKSSWHYRLLKKEKRRIYNNLCPYFWSVVGAIFKRYVLPAGLISIGTLVLIGLGVSAYQDIIESGSFFDSETAKFLLLVAFLIVLFFTVVFSGLAFGVVSGAVKNEYDYLLPSYLKAKKDKICPIIEFED